MNQDRGMDWMYQSAAAKEEQQKADNEAYLLGQEYNPHNVKSGDLTVGNEAVGISRIVDNIGTVHRYSGGNGNDSDNESFQKRHEDPMFMVNQTRKDREREIQKKKELFEKAAAEVREKRYGRREDSRSNIKTSRSTTTGRRERGRSLSYSSSSSYSSEDERRRRKKKTDKKRKKRRHRSYSSHEEEDDERYHRKSRKHSRRRERSVSYSRSHSPERKSSSRSHHKRSRRERSHSHDRHNKDRKRDNNKNYEEKEDRRSRRERSHSHDGHIEDRRRDNNGHDGEREEGQPKVFGLINSKAAPPNRSSNQSLGPDEKLLARKSKENEEARNRYRRRGNHDTKMTHEERQAALEAMQSDANKRISYLSKASEAKKVDLHDEEIQRRMREGSKDVSTFVHDVVMEVHGFSNQDKSSSLAKHDSRRRNNTAKEYDE